MERKSKNGSLSREEFLKYRSGKLTGKERNAFEKELQKDPFAEEAAEGFSYIKESEAEQDLKLLDKKLGRRFGKRSDKTIYRIAASIAILLSISAVFFFTFRKQGEMTLSDGAAVNKETDVRQELEIAKAEPLRKSPETITSPSLPVSQSPSPTTTLADIQSVGAGKAIESEPVKPEKDDKALQVIDSEVTENNFAEAAADEAVSEKAKEADKKGEYQKIAGVAAPMAARAAVSTNHIMPVPVNGMDSFNIYLEKNTRNPNPGGGEEKYVTLKFTVRTDSTISQIKVLESPGKKWSDEAKRLVIEGPRWVPARLDGIPVEETYTLKITFR